MSDYQPGSGLYRRRRFWLIGIAVAVVCAAAGAVAVNRIAVARDLAARKARAIDRISQGAGDLSVPIADLRQVLQHHPKDVQALAALARALPRQPKVDRQMIFESARLRVLLLEIDPKQSEERAELVRLLDLLGESEALTKFIDPLIEARPIDLTLHRLRTLHLVRLSRAKEAETAALRWSEAAPTSYDAQWTYLSLLMQAGKDQSQADSYLAKQVASNPNQPLWTLLRGTWQAAARHPEAAAATLTPLASADHLDPALVRPLVAALINLGNRTDGDRLLDEAAARESDASLVLIAALNDFDRGRSVRAMQRLREMKPPADPLVRGAQLATLAFLAHRTGNDALVEECRTNLDTLAPEVADSWRAVLLAITSAPLSPDAARQIMPALRGSVLSEDGLQLVQLATANCLVSLKQSRTADRLLLEMSRSPVAWSIGARRLFELRRSQGQFVQAIEIATYAFGRSGRTIDSAVVLALAVGESKPTGPQAENLFQLLRMIQQTVPGEVQTLGLYVDALAERRDPSAATVLRAALDKGQPIPLELLLQWAQLSQKHQLGLEQACFDKAQANFGSSPRVLIARAMVLHRSGQTAQALSLLRTARAESSEQDRRGYDEAIAQFLLITQSPDAGEAWTALAAAHPQDVGLQIRLIELGFARSAEQMRTLVDRIRKVEPGNITAELADIKLSLANSGLRSAKEPALLRLNRLVERVPDLIPARLAQIELLLSMNDPKTALAQWEKAILIAPEDPNLLLSGVQLLILNGERSRATEMLKKIERLDANLSTLQRLNAAKVYLSLGEVDRSIQILAAVPDLPRDSKLLLTEAYFRRGLVAEGGALLGELLKTPDLDTLLFAAAVEDSQGHADAANTLLSQAKQLSELTETDRLRVAEYASERGGLERVMGFLTGVDVSVPTTLRIAQLWLGQGNVDAAVKVMTDAASKTTEAAALQKRIKDEPKYRALVALKLNEIAAQLLEAPDDLATREMVEFAISTQKQTLREQQASLDRLAAMETKSYPLQMFLADRFLAVNQPAAAEGHARIAAAARPSAPQPMALAALAAARAGNTGRCLQAIAEWRDRLPADNSQPDSLDARTLAKRHEYTELLARYEPKLLASGGRASIEVLFAVAEAMHGRGRDADAITLLTPVIETDSRASVYWLNHLSNEVEPASAWKAINAYRQTILKRQLPSEQVALAIATDRVARRSRNPKWVDEGLAQVQAFELQASQLETELVAQLAQNRVDRQEFAQAAAIYQKAIAPRVDASALEARLADVLRQSGKSDEALAAIDRAIAAGVPTPQMHDLRAAILQDLDRLDDALAAAQAAQKLDELNPRWMMRVADLQQAKGDLVSSRPTLEMLRWFFREPGAWDAELIDRFRAFESALARRPTSRPNT